MMVMTIATAISPSPSQQPGQPLIGETIWSPLAPKYVKTNHPIPQKTKIIPNINPLLALLNVVFLSFIEKENLLAVAWESAASFFGGRPLCNAKGRLQLLE
jgi:hypothetical protein